MSRGLGAIFVAAAAVLVPASGSDAVDHGSTAVSRQVTPQGSLVAFPRPTVGYFVTARGVVRQSRDGGRTWRRIGSLRPLVALDFVSPNYGFALSKRGDFLTTTDQGWTWQKGRRFIPAPGQMEGPAPAMTVDFVDRRFGIVASGPRSIFRTRDGGHSWQRLDFGCPHGDYLAGIAFGIAVRASPPAADSRQPSSSTVDTTSPVMEGLIGATARAGSRSVTSPWSLRRPLVLGSSTPPGSGSFGLATVEPCSPPTTRIRCSR
jgi:photosynthesis system II assembly factor YCF48-like protein